ncbi:protein lin-37 homolog isoform X17 [Gallus gallus]|uniref:protein lin-37 homolog isoform X17 n=1 Tax=Gallus gallus TaxID=9031 RepID=UPI001AEA1EBC|nr:protein lin-37 homolog isoform X17 [Gallus gallus]
MLSLKVKVEKPDLEATSARSRLDAVLQGLLERSEGDREVLEDDAGKAVGDAVPKDASPSAPGKRGQPPTYGAAPHLGVSPPLMGQPHISPHRASRRFPPHRRKKRREAEEGQPDPPLQRPRPGCATALRGAPKSAPRRPNPPHICRAQPLEPPSMSALIYSNMERWKRVRQRWKEASLRQQQRYGASLRLLRRIYERQ